MRARVVETGLPLVYAHLVGGQDEVVFEGRSFALAADGSVAARAPAFVEKLVYALVEPAQGAIKITAEVAPERTLEADLWDALVLGVRDYVGKNGFPGAIIGLLVAGALLERWGWESIFVASAIVDALSKLKLSYPKVPAAERERIFAAFYRPAGHREGDGGGNGPDAEAHVEPVGGL